MTHQEIRDRLNNLDAWVAQITVSVDRLHNLVVAIAAAGEKADIAIAELAVAQKETTLALKAYLASQTRTNGH